MVEAEYLLPRSVLRNGKAMFCCERLAAVHAMAVVTMMLLLLLLLLLVARTHGDCERSKLL